MNRLTLLRFLLTAVSFISALIEMHSQGCSDTGVGSMPVFTPVKEIFTEGKKNWMSFGATAGAADFDIFALTSQIGYSRQIGKHFTADSRITAAWHTGNGVSSFGLGDVFFNLNYLPFTHFALAGGIKLRLNRADKFYTDEIAFPMDYQSSLGTIDFYTGISYHPGEWHFILIWQQPFVQNENLFYPSEIEHPESPFNDFPATFWFVRKGDVLFRIAKTFQVDNHWSITPGVLPVYHLEEDELPKNNDEGYYSVDGSKGLTLNITLLTSLKLNEGEKLEFNLGFPVVKREVQLEGLDRSFVLGGEFVKTF